MFGIRRIPFHQITQKLQSTSPYHRHCRLLSTCTGIHQKKKCNAKNHEVGGKREIFSPSKIFSRFYSVESSTLTTEEIPNAEIDNTILLDSTKDLGKVLKPREVVEKLDAYIVGQSEAKRAVAIALRNRWRRQRLPDDLINEVSPKNILMIGPTGCGKTEIARRLAKLAQAPFLKVEATKFTEIGFHGRDVDQIIRDLVDVSIKLVKKSRRENMKFKVQELVESRILDALAGKHAGDQSRETFLKLLRAGELEDRIIRIDVPTASSKSSSAEPTVEVLTTRTLAKVLGGEDSDKEKKSLTVAESRPILQDKEMEDAIDMRDVIKEAIQLVEQNGIVFIDEIDKVCSPGDYRGVDASSEGVQRDLLPIIEGSNVSTPHGNVNTDHILFIASGAFHTAKPSDLLAELQGRLPIRVELTALTEDDLHRILTEPVTNLIRQQVELLKTEDIEVEFKDEAIREIAAVSFQANKTIENIGARRLHTILEKVVEDVSFDASDMEDKELVIDREYVRSRVSKFLEKTDLSKFIL